MPIRLDRVYDPIYSCFSNFAPYLFALDDEDWPTIKHYFQAQKFLGTPYTETIRHAASPLLAHGYGRSRGNPLRPDWKQTKDNVMRGAVRAKFTQHADIRATLLSTGDEMIIENNWRDSYCGCGIRGTGKNMLGIILMETHDALRGAGG